MKQLQSNGSVLIKTIKQQKYINRNFAPWAARATNWYTAGRVTADSGMFAVWSTDFQLKDGSVWHYISAMGTDDAMGVLQDKVFSYPNGNNWFDRIGEGFNFLVRPSVYAKWTDDELFDWLDSH